MDYLSARVRSLIGVNWIRIGDPRSIGSQFIKEPMSRFIGSYPSDLGSQILIQITPKPVNLPQDNQFNISSGIGVIRMTIKGFVYDDT